MNQPDYTPIPMSKIREEPRKISISYHENATNWIGDKVKLASDIQNYANWYARQVGEAVRDACMDGLEYEDANRIQKINIESFIK